MSGHYRQVGWISAESAGADVNKCGCIAGLRIPVEVALVLYVHLPGLLECCVASYRSMLIDRFMCALDSFCVRPSIL